MLSMRTTVCAVLLVCVYRVEAKPAGRNARAVDSIPSKMVKGVDAMGFLKKFGYLDESPADIVDGQLRSLIDIDRQFKQAVRDFQWMYGLQETGDIDGKTAAMMKADRCGVPDVNKDGLRRRKRRETAQRFTHLGSKWENSRLTWKLTRPTHKLRTSDQKRTIRDAFKIWEDVAPLTIRETSGTPDMEIFFARGEHGDGARNGFDGPNLVLAHAFGPGKQPISGDAHFDNDEDWSLDAERGSDLLVVAAHEFGHSLGLGHSRDQGALMFPAYQSQDKLKLGYDDILSIQSLYGSRVTRPGYTVAPRRTPAPTRRPVHTRRPVPVTTPAPTPAPTTTPPACGVRFQAIVEGPERFYYAIKDDTVFKFKGDKVEADFPRPLGEVFQGAPSQPDMAFSVRESSKIYLLKGNQVWRYTDLELDEGFPLEFNRDHFPEDPKFTMSLVDDRGKMRVIVFGSRKWWFYNFDSVQTARPFPYDITSNWRGVPSDVHYSVRWTDNYYYLMSADSHVLFDHRRRVASDVGVVSGMPSWMDPMCAIISASHSSSTALRPAALLPFLVLVLIQLVSS